MKTLAFLLSLLVLGTPALASNRYVECVQRQLEQAGFSPGAIDGIFGSNTRLAMAQFLQADETGSFDTLPRLSKITAITWCRHLGGLGWQMSQHMPSQEDPAIVTEKGDETLEARLKYGFLVSRSFFNNQYGIRMASRFDIVAGRSADFVDDKLRQLNKAHGYDIDVPERKALNKKCNLKRNSANAFATPHYIVFCFGPAEDRTRSLDRFIVRVLAHEYVHQIQYELSAAKRVRYVKKGTRRIMGPNWMVEGSAGFFEREFDIRSQKNNDDLFRTYARMKDSKRPLKSLRRYGSVITLEEYSISEMAAYVLARKYGDDSLFEYFRQLGRGKSWEKAFEAAFGLSLSEFERQFEEARVGYGTLLKLAEPDKPANTEG